MSVKISIVVPIYNAEKYLERSLTSLLNQSIRDIEVIAVDDGSTDKSGEMLDRFSMRDDRIRAVHQVKQGQAAARNNALALAQGAYVGGLDADDWAEPDMFEQMYRRAQASNADIILCGWTVHMPGKADTTHFVAFLPQETLLEGSDYQRLVIPNLLVDKVPGYFWQKLYRRSILAEHDITVTETPNNSDWIFACEAFSHAQSLISCSIPLYHYQVHAKNQLTGVYRPHYFDNILYINRLRRRHLYEWGLGDSPEAMRAVALRSMEMILAAVDYEFLFAQRRLWQRAQAIRQIVNHPDVRNTLATYRDYLPYDRGRLFALKQDLLKRRLWGGLFLLSWVLPIRKRWAGMSCAAKTAI